MNDDSDALIQASRKHWSLGKAKITLVAARENRVYRVSTPSKTYALRFHRPGYRTLAEVNAELLWMDRLAQNGVLVPQPVKARDNQYVAAFNGTIVDMLYWVEGTPLGKLKPTVTHYYQLGCLLARMHTLADQWQPPAEFVRPHWNLTGDQPTWGRFWENPLLNGQQQQCLSQFRQQAAAQLRSLASADTGLIHADLVPDNVLVNDSDLCPIDFDDGGYGYRLFDVATVTFRSHRICENGQLANAVLDGYCTLRPLDQDLLPLFEALRACTYVGWNIARMHEPDARTRNERFITEALTAIDRLAGDVKC